MLNEHGIYIRHCQESNSQPVPSQAEADTTRPQWRSFASYIHLFQFPGPSYTIFSNPSNRSIAWSPIGIF